MAVHKKKRRKPPKIREEIEASDLGMKVLETTVWHGGQSRSFTMPEIKAGAAEEWIKDL